MYHPKNKPFFIETWGGIGDAWLVSPSFQAIKSEYPDSEISVLCMDNHYEIFEMNQYIDFLSYSPESPEFHDSEFLVTNYANLKPSINFNKHATEIIADMFGVQLKEKKPQFFFKNGEEKAQEYFLKQFKNPITINISSKCSKFKEWPIENWNQLIKQLPDFTFIQLGLKNEKKIIGAIDMRGKTTVREAIALVKNSDCFVGVDSFLGHATAAVQTPGVVMFGPSTPTVWGYGENINLYKRLDCSPCIDTHGGRDCNSNVKCMNSFTPEEVQNAVLKLMASKN